MPLLEVTGLVKTYGHRRVVDGVDFVVDSGEIVGLLGPNGAGKTTSFRMTCGLIEPDAGKVMLADKDVTDWPMFLRSDGGMGYLAQEQSVFRKLSVENNLLAVMELLGMDRTARRKLCEQLLEQFDIQQIRRSKAMYISGGEKRRLENRAVPDFQTEDYLTRRAIHGHRPGDNQQHSAHHPPAAGRRHRHFDYRPSRAGNASNHRSQLRHPRRQSTLPRLGRRSAQSSRCEKILLRRRRTAWCRGVAGIRRVFRCGNCNRSYT